MATIISNSPLKDYDIVLITDDGVTYYKEKRFLWFTWLKQVTP